jgi:Glycosyl transferases group 1
MLKNKMRIAIGRSIYLITKSLLFFPMRLVRGFGSNLSESNVSVLAIESGAKGWGLIEYEELLASAEEFFGSENVVKVTVESSKTYLSTVKMTLKNEKITHYFFDPRTGSQHFFLSLIQTFLLALVLQRRGVIPIARLTDLPFIRWRFQCILLTSLNGVCVCVMSRKCIGGRIPHDRIVGPALMALSKGRLRKLISEKQKIDPTTNPRVVFVGAMYEPRASFILDLKKELCDRNIEIQLFTRELGEQRSTSELYWERLVTADIIFTTAFVLYERGMEHIDELHLGYRYTEACAAGALLIAQDIDGLENVLVSGRDFMSYKSVIDAANQIEKAYKDKNLLRGIARNGTDAITREVMGDKYWLNIDKALGNTGFVRSND